MKQLTRLACIVLVALILTSLLAACNTATGTRAPARFSQPLTGAQPAMSTSGDNMTIQADPQADEIEQSLTDLDNQLKSTDTLDDFK